MKLKKLSSVSNKVLLLFFITAFVLILSFYAFNDLDINISQKIVQSELYKNDAVSYLQVFDTISRLVLYFGLIEIVFASLITKAKGTADFERNRFTEALLISFSFMNITLFAFYSSIYLFSYIPAFIVFIPINLVVFILTFVIAFLKRTRADADATAITFWKKVDARLLRFGFPNFRFIGLILFGLSILICLISGFAGMPKRFEIKFLNCFSFILGALGVLYFVLGRHYKVKKSGELEKIILLEQSNFVLNFLYLFLFAAILLAANFHLEIHFTEAIIFFGPVITISIILAESKYK
jgi:hypothetical protein